MLASIHAVTARPLPRLHSLNLSNNHIGDSVQLVKGLRRLMPNLVHLYVIGNPCCPLTMPPDMLQKYRAYFVRSLPQLRSLDGYPVSSADQNLGQQLFGR